MNTRVKTTVMMLTVAAVLAAGGTAFAHEHAGRGAGAQPGHGMMGHMMGGGMMGGGMMAPCERMMGGGSALRMHLPALPPGNEKLQFRMHAEMMQKIGEIAARYADQIQEAE